MKMKESYGPKQSLTHYKPGDLVLYGTESSQLHTPPKLKVNFQVPYLDLAKLGDLDYRIQLNVWSKQKVVYHDKLNLYEGEQGLPLAKSTHKAHKPKTK